MRRIFRRRSSATGQFVTPEQAANDPAGTVVERVDHVRAAAQELVDSLRTSGDLYRLSVSSVNALDALAARLGE